MKAPVIHAGEEKRSFWGGVEEEHVDNTCCIVYIHLYGLSTRTTHGAPDRVPHHLVSQEEFAHLKRMPSLWTRSTFYSTAGNVSAEVIEQYIERQGRT